MADRIAVHGRYDLCGMRLIQSHFPKIVVVLVDQRDFARLLQQFDVEIPEDVGNRILHALVVRDPERMAGERDFTALADYLRGFRFQNRIAVIADEQIEICQRPRAGGICSAPGRGRTAAVQSQATDEPRRRKNQEPCFGICGRSGQRIRNR